MSLNATISVAVDPANPGQFFACCGMLELADRLWPGAVGWFADGEFGIACAGTLRELLDAGRATIFEGVQDNEVDDEDSNDDESELMEPLVIASPIHLRLDWWGDRELKTWAGSMNIRLIAGAMCGAIDSGSSNPLNQLQVVYDPPRIVVTKSGKQRLAKPKKREPFYFDARRAPNSHSRDVGFAPNDLSMLSTAAPVVEFFCLIGLQRCRPRPTDRDRVLDYYTWPDPTLPELLPVIVPGVLRPAGAVGYRFENWYRTGQKKHKAFRVATPIPAGD